MFSFGDETFFSGGGCGGPNPYNAWLHGQWHVDTYLCVSSAFVHQTNVKNRLSAKNGSKTHKILFLARFGRRNVGFERPGVRVQSCGPQANIPHVTQPLARAGLRGATELGWHARAVDPARSMRRHAAFPRGGLPLAGANCAVGRGTRGMRSAIRALRGWAPRVRARLWCF